MAAVRPMSKPAKPPQSGVVVPHKPRWHQRLAAALIYLLIRMVSATIRYEWQDTSGILKAEPDQPVIFCTWHNRLALCLEVSRVYLRSLKRPCKLAALVSASKDGGLLSRVLEHYGVQPVRGSSSRRGRQALLELVSWGERGYDIAITPDGPRGPCYTVQEGIISLAQLTGRPILVVSNHLTWKIQLKSWDRFQIPLPFTKCVMQLTPPIHVPREISEEERAQLRAEVEARLKSVTID